MRAKGNLGWELSNACSCCPAKRMTLSRDGQDGAVTCAALETALDNLEPVDGAPPTRPRVASNLFAQYTGGPEEDDSAAGGATGRNGMRVGRFSRACRFVDKLGLQTNGTVGTDCPQRCRAASMAWHGGIAFTGLTLVAVLAHYERATQPLAASMAATAVLLYAAPESALAQPRNCIGGHVLSAIVGVTIQKLLHSRGGDFIWLSQSLAVTVSIVGMDMTRTLHPPGASTALVAVQGNPEVTKLGYVFVVAPVLVSAVLMLVVAVIGNNLRPDKRYPLFWY